MAAATVVGRADERGLLTDVVRGARDGQFGAVVIEGDAGIGKTTLVREACAAAGDDALVLPGACLPLTSVAVPLLGLRSGVRALSAAERPVCLGGLRGGPGPVPVPVAFDEWLAGACSERPVVLVVDDLHWADGETLDALTYVLAGPESRRLAVIVTVRATDVGPRHPLQRWLADARRLPRVREVVLGPMSRDEVAEEVGLVFGGAAHTSLVDEVFTRSGGNPYFVRLLVSGLGPSDRSLPAHLPEQLSAAAVGGWALLSAAAKRFTVVLAVGGRPAAGESLDRVTALTGITEIDAVLHEAVDSGLVDLAPDGSIWFHHPLQAEVLEQELLPQERRALHARFAAGYAHDAIETPTAELAATVSDHFALAEDPASAYSWSVEAAHRLEGTGESRQRLRMLRRAVLLWGSVSEVEESLEELLTQTVDTAAAVADWDAQIEAIGGLLEVVDDTKDPLRVATLLTSRAELRFTAGRGDHSSDVDRAVELVADGRGTWQRLVVLAQHVRTLLWYDEVDRAAEVSTAVMAELEHGEQDGAPPADDAMAWQRATAAVLSSAAMLAMVTNDPDRARLLARRAADLSYAAGDVSGLVGATFWEAGAETSPSLANAQVFGRCRGQLVGLGAPHPYIGWLCACEAAVWFRLGEWSRCADLLREALGADPGPAGDGIARLTAAQLAAGQGRLVEARAHLARAEEITLDPSHTPFLHFDLTRAQVLLAAGDREGAVEAALAVLDAPGVPDGCEWLLPIAVRALADECERARDSGAPVDGLSARVDALVAEHPRTLRDLVPLTDAYLAIVAALDALYVAEVERAHALPSVSERWCAAVEALETAGLRWEEAYAAWRAAAAMLRGAPGGDDRRKAAQMLRRAHAIAGRLGAAPLMAWVEGLGRSARISLSSVPAEPDVDAAGGALAALTPRERDVLAHVVAGRTYAEIADALFLSEKTVSSHISNMLRKTGVANRVELAAWAQRRASA